MTTRADLSKTAIKVNSFNGAERGICIFYIQKPQKQRGATKINYVQNIIAFQVLVFSIPDTLN